MDRQINSSIFERTVIGNSKLSAVLREIHPNITNIYLLFYHKELQCLVAIELKADRFKPEHMGQINLYLEALDRDVKNDNENPSIGILFCKDKDKEVVEYTLSRCMSPTLIAEYQTKLPDKKILQKKLHEILVITKNLTNRSMIS
ncbi:PDDEXK nuclease domain-containing protein [Chitinophaga polysaccharea]|uniref:PDDEXK nuclease domain-containing protein n=1 Tax=Chitinophaga polysaccharea TaxID=1293035 RepID=UPI001C8E3504|nr:PDDEXK nuclease domain-containing protein [Chitinophaga polysaccharea]